MYKPYLVLHNYECPNLLVILVILANNIILIRSYYAINTHMTSCIPTKNQYNSTSL